VHLVVKSKVVPVYHRKAYKGSRGTTPPILKLDTGWKWSTSRLAVLPPGEQPRYPLNRRLGGLQSQSGRFAEDKSPLPLPRFKPWTVQPVD